LKSKSAAELIFSPALLSTCLAPKARLHRQLAAARHPDISNPSALKARFIAVVDNMKSDEEHLVS
jgi:hypothetical protein